MNIEEILKKEINNLKQNNIENSTLKAKILLANVLNVKNIINITQLENNFVKMKFHWDILK